ncbi:VOC family protein [Actinospongicola halichondriae]|uniref:VOC family protein n=1 Tax=Actinospongicola halichondriae TaxID=3236844 RepID=UPI003D428E09
MRITEIDHVVLNVADVHRSLEFYAGVLGLEPVRLAEWEAGEALFVSVRVHDGFIIDLMEVARSGENADHFCLVVEDDIDDLIAAGTITPTDGPFDLFGARGQGYSVYLNDPDGNRVELRNYRD